MFLFFFRFICLFYLFLLFWFLVWIVSFFCLFLSFYFLVFVCIFSSFIFCFFVLVVSYFYIYIFGLSFPSFLVSLFWHLFIDMCTVYCDISHTQTVRTKAFQKAVVSTHLSCVLKETDTSVCSLEDTINNSCYYEVWQSWSHTNYPPFPAIVWLTNRPDTAVWAEISNTINSPTGRLQSSSHCYIKTHNTIIHISNQQHPYTSHQQPGTPLHNLIRYTDARRPLDNHKSDTFIHELMMFSHTPAFTQRLDKATKVSLLLLVPSGGLTVAGESLPTGGMMHIPACNCGGWSTCRSQCQRSRWSAAQAMRSRERGLVSTSPTQAVGSSQVVNR